MRCNVNGPGRMSAVIASDAVIPSLPLCNPCTSETDFLEFLNTKRLCKVPETAHKARIQAFV